MRLPIMLRLTTQKTIHSYLVRWGDIMTVQCQCIKSVVKV